VQATVDRMPSVKGGSPSLIFVFSDEERIPPEKARKYVPKPTQQAEESAAAWSELFQTEGNFSIFIPGRLFNIVRADATKVKPEDNKFLCSPKAPCVVMTDKDGKVLDVYQGKARIKRAPIVDAMVAVLRRDGIIGDTASFVKLEDLTVQLEKAEVQLLLTQEEIAKAEAKLKTAQTSKTTVKNGELNSSGETAKRLIEKLQDRSKKEAIQKYDILKQEYALLKNLGLPAARMPKEPVAP
jgi:hypothetical protein